MAKQNQILNGRMRAFADFRNILAEQISVAFPELRQDVAMVLRETSGKPRLKLEEAPAVAGGSGSGSGSGSGGGGGGGGANGLGDGGALGSSGPPSTASAS